MAEKETPHIALPLKYRPMTFEDVVGQEHVVRTLKNAISSGRIANAYLFIGSRGIGKTTLSRIFAKALNCLAPTEKGPCGVCENCRQIAEGRALDVTELDGASHNKVEDVRPIIESVAFKPAASKFKVFIVDECHMLTPAAWNALLKTLEEPPPYVKFIFATTEGDKLLATIISRCQRFDLRRIRTDQIVSRLQYVCTNEKIDAAEDALLAIARGAEGGMRDALSSLDQLIAFKGQKITEEDALGVFGLVSRSALEGLAEAVLTGDAPAILKNVDAFESAGKNMRRLASELMTHFRNLIVVSALKGDAGAVGLEVTDDQRKVLVRQAALCDDSRIFRIADELAKMEDQLRYVLSVRTLIEMTLLRASRIATTASIDELLRAVRALKAAAPAPVAPAPAPAPAAPAPALAPAPAPAPAVPAPAPAAPAPAPAKAAAPASKTSPKASSQTPITAAEREKMMADPKLNALMAAMPGAHITEIK